MDSRIWHNISSHDDDDDDDDDDYDDGGEVKLRSSCAVWRNLQDCMSERTSTVGISIQLLQNR